MTAPHIAEALSAPVPFPTPPGALERAKSLSEQIRAAQALPEMRAQAVREALEQGHSASEVAVALGISRARVYQLTKGENRPANRRQAKPKP